jgi:hypothetical protein
MNQEVIVRNLKINRPGERIHFQITLPNDIKCISGFEYDVRRTEGTMMLSLKFGWEGDQSFKRYRNQVIGQICLQSSGCEGIFYHGNLVEDRNIWQHEGIAAALYTPRDWILSRKREEITFCVGGNIIEGYFIDSFSKGEYIDLKYELTLYFWMEKCTK